MKMFVAGEWVDKPQKIEVRNPFDNSVLDTVPKADSADVERALAGAVEGPRPDAGHAGVSCRLSDSQQGRPADDRAREKDRGSSARKKTILGGIAGGSRSPTETIELSAEGNGSRARCCRSTPPLMEDGEIRLPSCPLGIVACITPFNFHSTSMPQDRPGNRGRQCRSRCSRPATRRSAASLVEILLDAGLPPQAIACITGPAARSATHWPATLSSQNRLHRQS